MWDRGPTVCPGGGTDRHGGRITGSVGLSWLGALLIDDASSLLLIKVLKA